MAVLQRILFCERRRERRRRSKTTYINAFVRSSFNPLEVLPDEAIIRKFRLSRGQIMELLGGYAAVNVMVVCSAEGEFLDVVARWPGSTHDAFIWENSGLCRAAEGGGFGGCWLLGDSGFPLRPFLLTPYLHAQTEPQASYNRAHRLTRAVVERAIGVWKQRFRCLNKGAGGLQLHPRKCCAVTVVAALLHNMALRANIQLPDDEGLQDEEAEDNLPVIQDLHPAGQQVRQVLVDNLFGP
ncbi:hypothetical protein ACEWY4_025546 [Coilia grayii]|uniref:DDE Tnp4 domain-containing protein n=1 Tax=Coilia grayii TaxID=363190 RepID=A0ABD1IXW4_9TELE